MSATAPAYHLRTNKSGERQLFVELLRKMDGQVPRPLREYAYVGMGGPYLEDFQLIQQSFGSVKPMTCLELDPRVVTRQRINKPHSRVFLTLKSTTHFVERYTTTATPRLVWFDYTNKSWEQQITDCCDLIPKLPPFSIFKVTFTCAPIGSPEKEKDPLGTKAKLLEERFGDLGPFAASDMRKERFHRAIYQILRRSLANRLPDTEGCATRTLSAYAYDDKTPVLTVTLLIAPSKGIDDVIEKAKLKNWPYAVLNWGAPVVISIPDLSLRERQAIDRMLPTCNASRIVNSLDLRLESSDAEGLPAVERYITFYRHVPLFFRVTP